MDDLLQKEQLVASYISQNNREAAVKLLFELIVRYAKEKKDFAKAEVLRQKLFQVDEMALTEIIASAEIIEAAKSQSIDRAHMDIWSELYSTLTTEEANALYFAMKEVSYDPDREISKQGDLDSGLYFIDQGQLKMVYKQGSSEIFLDSIKGGDIVGEDTFFSNTVSTVSVVALSPVKLHYLDNSILPHWRTEFPLLESKLREYCARLRKLSDLLMKKHVDRRAQARLKISGKAHVQLIGTKGTLAANAFKGELSDISLGGLTFFIRISKKETARLLLGRKLNVKFELALGKMLPPLDTVGTVVAVRAYPFDDHSVHVKFDTLLDRNIIAEIESCPNPTTSIET